MKIKMVKSLEEQLELWINGTSTHRKITLIGKEQEECCPDFSCCKPHLLQPIEVRRAFIVANNKDKNKMLAFFLGCLLDGFKVYITDGKHSLES